MLEAIKKAIFPHKQPHRQIIYICIKNKNVMTWTLAFNTLIIQNNTWTKLNRGEVECKRMMGFFLSFFFFLAAERGTPLKERETKREGWGRVIQSHHSTLLIQPLDGFFFSSPSLFFSALLPPLALPFLCASVPPSVAPGGYDRIVVMKS